jgi:hypothetical protein
MIIIDSTGWRASIGWRREAVLRSRFFFSGCRCFGGSNGGGRGEYSGAEATHPSCVAFFSLLLRAPVPDVEIFSLSCSAETGAHLEDAL